LIKFVTRGLIVAGARVVLVSEDDNNSLMVGEGGRTVDAGLVGVGNNTDSIAVLLKDL